MNIEMEKVLVWDKTYSNQPPRKITVTLTCEGTHDEQLAFLIEACQFVQATNKLFAPENEEKNDD